MRRTTRSVRALAALALTLVAISLPGCWTLSLHPLYSEDDLVFEPGLEGVWGDPDDPDDGTWQFLARDESSYRLVIREGNDLLVDPAKDGLFEARLVRLGDHLFLDLFPEMPETGSDYFEAHVIPGHSFGRITLEGHVLRLASLDAEWLKNRLAEDATRLDHEVRDGEIILTASTEDLQAFLVKHAAEAFDDEEVLYRLQ